MHFAPEVFLIIGLAVVIIQLRGINAQLHEISRSLKALYQASIGAPRADHWE